MAMAEAEDQRQEQQSPLPSFDAYVEALQSHLIETKSEESLGTMGADLATRLDSLQLSDTGSPVETTYLLLGRHKQAQLSTRHGMVTTLSENSSPQEALEFFALATAKVKYYQDHYPDSPALRGFTGERAKGKFQREANYIIKNGYWSGGYDPEFNKALRAGVIGVTAAVMVACAPEAARTLIPPTQTQEVRGINEDIRASFETVMKPWEQVQFHDTENRTFKISESVRLPVTPGGSVIYLEQIPSSSPDQKYPNVSIGRATVVDEAGDKKDILFLFDMDADGKATKGYYLRFVPESSNADNTSFAVISAEDPKNLTTVGIFDMPTTVPQQDKPFGTLSYLSADKGLVFFMMPVGTTKENHDNTDAFVAFLSNASPALAQGLSPTATPDVATNEPTKDPDMPEGATGKNYQGEWTKTENGVTYTWTKIQYGGNPDNVIQEWTRVGTVDPAGIWLIDKRGFDEIPQSSIRMQVHLMDDISQFGKFILVDHPDPLLGPSKASFSSIFDMALLKTLKVHPGSDWYNAEVGIANGNLDGKYDLTFKNRDGITHMWNPAAGYDFYETSWDKLDPKTNINITEEPDTYFPNVVFRYGLTTDPQTKKLIGYGAIKMTGALTDEQKNNAIIKLTLMAVSAIATGAQAHSSQYGTSTPEPIDWLAQSAVNTQWGPPHFVLVTQ